MSDDLFLRLSGEVERTVDMPAGSVLFRAEDAVSSVFLVAAGTVVLERTAATGARLMLQRAMAGDILAEASIFSPRYHCDAVATEPCRLGVLSMVKFRRLERTGPELRGLLAVYLAGRLQAARTQSAILSLRTVAERLDAWLDSGTRQLPARGQWHELAHSLAVSPEALYRELARRKRHQLDRLPEL